jgi:hypothetical protein
MELEIYDGYIEDDEKILKFSGKYTENGEPDSREERAKTIVKFFEEQISSKLYNEIVKELINKRILEPTQFKLENKHWAKE